MAKATDAGWRRTQPYRLIEARPLSWQRAASSPPRVVGTQRLGEQGNSAVGQRGNKGAEGTSPTALLPRYVRQPVIPTSRPLMMASASPTIRSTSSLQVGMSRISPMLVPADQMPCSTSPVS